MTRSTTYTYELPNGAKVDVESEDIVGRGPREVGAEKAPTELPLANIIVPIGEVAQTLFEAVKARVSQPD